MMDQELPRIPDAGVAEAFQGLRLRIEMASRERPIRTLLVAAPDDVEEKTSVVAYLGVVFAQAGRRVVLVSADLHRPDLEAIFGVESAPGLREVAVDELALRSVARPTRVPNLEIVPAGRVAAHPADVLASPAVGRMLEEARARADLVVVEGPPVLGSAEASLLVASCDAVLLVLEAGRTSRTDAAAAKAALEKVRDGATFLGVVLANTRGGRRQQRRRRSLADVGERRTGRGRRSRRGTADEPLAPRSPDPGIGGPDRSGIEGRDAGVGRTWEALLDRGTGEEVPSTPSPGELAPRAHEAPPWEAAPTPVPPEPEAIAAAEEGGPDVGHGVGPSYPGALGDAWAFGKRSRLVGAWPFRAR